MAVLLADNKMIGLRGLAFGGRYRCAENDKGLTGPPDVSRSCQFSFSTAYMGPLGLSTRYLQLN